MLIEGGVVVQICLEGGRQNLCALPVLTASSLRVIFEAIVRLDGLRTSTGSLVSRVLSFDTGLIFPGVREGCSVVLVAGSVWGVWQLAGIPVGRVAGF